VYLLYACLSTLVWLLCVVSSILSYSYNASQKRSAIVWGLSIASRRAAKTLATINAFWLFLSALYQYTNLGNNCWCSSARLSLQQKAYVPVVTPNHLTFWGALIWVGSLAMSILAAGLFLLAINLLRKRPERLYEPSSGCEELQSLNTRH